MFVDRKGWGGEGGRRIIRRKSEALEEKKVQANLNMIIGFGANVFVDVLIAIK